MRVILKKSCSIESVGACVGDDVGLKLMVGCSVGSGEGSGVGYNDGVGVGSKVGI